MGKIFVTSDTHFGHDREFLWGPRGFTNFTDHDEKVIENWNKVVNPEDTVYHLGDVMLGDNAYGIACLKRLNGNIKIIPGNHDTSSRLKLYRELENVEVLGLAEMLKYKKYNFYLSHHPTITSNLEKAPYLRMHLINLFGHTHQQNKFYMSMPYMFHVGMDSNNCTPVLLDDAIEMMKAETQICIEFLGLTEEKTSEEPAVPTCKGCFLDHLCPDVTENIRCNKYAQDKAEVKGV